jgi:hypothetical protein
MGHGHIALLTHSKVAMVAEASTSKHQQHPTQVNGVLILGFLCLLLSSSLTPPRRKPRNLQSGQA